MGNVFVSSVLIGAVLAVLLVDTLGSILSKSLKFNYMVLAPLSVVIWIGSGIFVSKDLGVWSGALAAGTVGLIDSTIGQYLSYKIKPYLGKERSYNETMAGYNLSAALQMALCVSVIAFVLGLAASFIASRLV